MAKPGFIYIRVCPIGVIILYHPIWPKWNPVVFKMGMFGLWPRARLSRGGKTEPAGKGFQDGGNTGRVSLLFSDRYFDLGREWQLGEGHGWLRPWGCLVGSAF